jgi:ferrochelatase
MTRTGAPPGPQHLPEGHPAVRIGRIGVLLVNLGTPDGTGYWPMRRYLKEFLSDRRVIEEPRLKWWLILNLIILTVRPGRKGKDYAKIWNKQRNEGPLKTITRAQAEKLSAMLADERILVDWAMRYANPSAESRLVHLKEQGCDRLLLVPLYPQYAAATTASVGDAVAAWMKRCRNLPELRFVKHYHDHPAYIGALARRVNDHWMMYGRPDRLVLSFHGLPKRSLTLGDPYHCECLKTGRLLTERLKLREENVVVTFQSRFGKAEWLKPYTGPTLVALAKEGVARVDVFCPGFAADCLETLEEIDLEARAVFLAAGGKEFGYIPCLNDQHEGIAALAAIAIEHMVSWTTAPPPEPADLERSKQRARAAGAAA